MKHRFALAGVICLGVGALASARPTDVPRILIVGDSWAGSMQLLRCFDALLPEYAGLAGNGQRGQRTTLYGIRASEYKTPTWLDMVTEELVAYPTIDIAHVCLSGNDFLLDSHWYPGMPPEEGQVFIDQVNADIEVVLDHILAIRPNIRVALCGYTFVNHVMAGGTVAEVNAAWAQCEEAKLALAEGKDRVFYVHSLGLMQYHFGIPQATPPVPPAPEPGHAPMPGGYAEGYVPMPGGDADYGAPLASLIDDALHLTLDGYDLLAQRCIEEFYQAWLSWPVVLEILWLTEGTKGPEHVFQVTFSEPVTGVDAADFAVTAGAKAPSVVEVDGSGAVYTVTVDMDGETGVPQLTVLDDDSITDGDTNPLGGPGVGNGGFDHVGPLAYAEEPITSPDDFDACMASLSQVILPLGALPEGVSLDPEECDVNGGSITIDPPGVVGNGMLDSCELALIRGFLRDESLDFSDRGGASHAMTVAAWEQNLAQMQSDFGGVDGRALIIAPGLDSFFAGLMTLGDPASMVIPVLLVAAANLLTELPPGITTPNPANYLGLAQYFGPDGDADGDGYTNREEHEFFVPLGGRDLYAMAALDPAATPEPQCTNTTGGTYTEGEAFCLIVPDPVDLAGGFEWVKDGQGLENDGRVLGTHWRELHVDPLELTDSGSYMCLDGGGAPIFGPVDLVVEEKRVPVAGPGALALLALAALVGGVIGLRRRRQAG